MLICHSNNDSNTQTNINSGPVKTVTIRYIRGTSETIARILQPYNVRVAHKPITTWRRQLTDVKDKDKSEDRQVRQGEVYKIKYCNCQATYIGETSRKLACDWLNTNAEQEMVTSTIILLSTIIETKHQIDWDSATCIMYSTVETTINNSH